MVVTAAGLSPHAIAHSYGSGASPSAGSDNCRTTCTSSFSLSQCTLPSAKPAKQPPPECRLNGSSFDVPPYSSFVRS